MKKIFILALVLLGIRFQSHAQITWDGGGSTNNWTEGANWSGNNVPTTNDNVIFDNTSGKNCIMNNNINVNDITVANNYTGTISSSSGGRLIRGNLTINGGTFSCTTGNTTIRKNFTLNGGSFVNNGGTVVFEVDNSNIATVISGSPSFNVLRLEDNGSGELFFNFGTSTVSTLFLDNSSDGATWSFSGNVAVQSELNILGASSAVPTTNTSIITLNGAGPITVNGAALAGEMLLNDFIVNTSGNAIFNDNINLRGTWTGTQGTLTAGTSTVNFYGTSAAISGTAAAFDNLILQSGASVSFPASAEVNLTSDFVCTGATASFPTTSTLSFNGTTAQGITGTFTAGSIHVKSGGGRTVTTNSALTIVDALTVDATATFALGSNTLTLPASGSGSARVAESAGTITGSNVRVETFIPAGSTGWTNMGVRGVHNQTILSWDTYSVSGGTTGIPMTCVGCAYNPTVIGTGSSSFTSVQEWSETSNSFIDIASTYNFTPGKGIWAYVGDGSSATGNLKVVNTGSLVQGALTIPLTSTGSSSNTGFNLVANPYASPISWEKTLLVVDNGISMDASVYIWNPDLASGAGAYTSYNATTDASSPGGAGSMSDIIAGGQGFYVFHTNITFDNIDFNETCKISNSAALLKPAEKPNVKLFRLKLAGSNDWDATVFCVHPEASNSYDRKFDARKIFQTAGYAGYPGAYSKYTTISSKDNDKQDYSINTLAPLVSSVNIPILTRVSTSGSYTISAYDFKDFGMCVGLIDKLDNSYHDLRLSPHVFTISDTTSAPRFELVLCKDESLNTVGISEATESNSIFITQDAQGAYVKTVFEKNTKAIISVYNIIGQKLMKDVTVEGMVTNTALPIELHNQVVIIKVTTDKETVTKKMVLQ